MEGPRDGPRIINGIEIIYGTRSACDMQGWNCPGCQTRHEAIRMLVFDVAPLRCRVCNLPNPNGFSICLATVMINRIPIIEGVKCQKPGEGECVSYAASHLIELMNTVLVAISSDQPDKEKARLVLNPDVFSIPYERRFLNLRGGVHKLVHQLQRLTNGIGIRMTYKNDETRLAEEYFKGGEIRMIHCDDFEEVVRQIADGNAVIAPLYIGANYSKLQFCQFYTSVPKVKIDQRPKPGHVVLLIGAICENQVRAYFGLDSAGTLFCKQPASDEGWFSIMRHGYKAGGYGKIDAGSYFRTNFFKLSRPGDTGVPPKLYDDPPYGVPEEELGDIEYKIDLVLDAEPEDNKSISWINRLHIFHGRR